MLDEMFYQTVKNTTIQMLRQILKELKSRLVIDRYDADALRELQDRIEIIQEEIKERDNSQS
jgi:folylpolyglutamate synthase/dihydropteroate synthase